MKRIIYSLLFTLSFQLSMAAEVVYDVVTLETVRLFCEERKVEFSEWQVRYSANVERGKGVIYPRKGIALKPASKQQQDANQISFYCEWRLKRGDVLHALSEQWLVFRNEPAK